MFVTSRCLWGLVLALAVSIQHSSGMAVQSLLAKEQVDEFSLKDSKDDFNNHVPYDRVIEDIEKDVLELRPVVYSLHVESEISYRLAHTVVSSRLANKFNLSREAHFSMELPEAAFITNFTLKIGQQLIVGEVKEKEEAKQIYDTAVSRGQTAAHVSVKPRETNRFQISVNMAPYTKLRFELTYQELLTRTLGSYVHVVNIRPGQVVRDMKVDVAIRENRPLTMVKVPPITPDLATKHYKANEIREEQEYVQITYGDDGKSAFIEFHPDPLHQILISNEERPEDNEVTSGVQGQFAVFYDVERTADVGEVYLADGYFVHFFAPTSLEVVSKHVMFVLDVSGSMSGTKISQLKDAMHTILDDLKEGDYFNIITFESEVSMWKDASLPVNDDSVFEAKEFVTSLQASGGTNINQAVLDGISFLGSQQESTLVSILIFLTDGQATSGVTDNNNILENVRNANIEFKFPIYSLAFGRNADFSIAQQMSLQNTGIARKIYEDSDAVLQLKGFYDEISSPLLADVSINYLNNTVERESVVRDKVYRDFFDGCEIVICGRMSQAIDRRPVVMPFITGSDADGNTVVFSNVVEEGNMEQTALNRLSVGIERMWVYLSIKELLNKNTELGEGSEAEEAKDKALQLSLKYNFVTPLTSMVVTLPDENKSPISLQDTDDTGTNLEMFSLSHTPIRSRGAYGAGGGMYNAPRFPSPMMRGQPGLPGLPGRSGVSHSRGFPSIIAHPPNPYLGFDDDLFGSELTTTEPTTTELPTTTTPAPIPCVPINKSPETPFEIFYDDFADFYIRGRSSAANLLGDIYLSSVEVLSRSLSFRVLVSLDGVTVNGGDRIAWGERSYSLHVYQVDLVMREEQVTVEISDTLDRVAVIRIGRKESCLSYEILSDRYALYSS